MKKRMLIWVLVLSLLLSPAAMGAMVMGSGETAEVPRGEEVPAAVRLSGRVAPERPAVGEEDSQRATLADAGGHTAAEHSAWTPLYAAGTLESGSYYLDDNVDGNIVIPADAEVELCLNGRALNAQGSGTVITVNSGATLKIHDCSELMTGSVTNGYGVGAGGVKVMGGTLELYGGNITGNATKVKSTGGGVCLYSGGKLAMYGGSVTGNNADNGGGVYINTGCTFTMTGGQITGNTAKNSGGGVYIYTGDNALPFKLSGNPVITGNTAGGKANNVDLKAGRYISIPAALESTARVGVSVDAPGMFAAPRSNLSTEGMRENFTSDDSNYAVGINAEGRMILGAPATVTYHVPSGVTGTVPEDQHCVAGETVTLDTQAVMVKGDGYQFAGWTNNVYSKTAVATILVEGDTTVYPVFHIGYTTAAVSTDIQLTYGEDIRDIELRDFVQPIDSGMALTFSFMNPEGLPNGLDLVDDNGRNTGVNKHILTGKVMDKPGDYPVTIAVRAMNGTAALFDLGESVFYGTGKLYLTLHVAKPEVSAADFDFTAPEDIYQDGQAKVASITPKNTGIARGVGAITLKYSPAEPVEIGTYQVSVDVAEGAKYAESTDLSDPSWTFTIRLGNPKPAAVTYTPGGKLSAAALPAGWEWVNPDAALTVANSGYQAVYTIPADGTSGYDWSEEEGYNANGTITRTVAVTVNKATPEYEIPEGCTGTYGALLSTVPLPARWSWLTPNATLSDAEQYLAAYVPEDTDNYRRVTGIAVPVTILGGNPAFVELQGTNAVVLKNADKASDATIIAVRHDAKGGMVDLAWDGTLSGNTVTFAGKTLALDSGWKLIFLDSNYAPVCPAVPLVSPKTP